MKHRSVLLFSLIMTMALGACSFRGGSSSVEESSSKKVSYSQNESSVSIQPSESSLANQSSEYSFNSSFFINDDSPTFDSISEVAYYSYMKENSSFFKGLSPKRKIETKANDGDEEERTDYTDEEGRLHYVIPYDYEFVFYEFLYFSFEMENNEFLKDKIGTGTIKGLTVNTNAFGEKMIVLKNGDKYFSCLINGGGGTQEDYSSHKTLQYFEIVKDAREKKHLYLSFVDGLNPLSASSIEIDGESYNINADTTYYYGGSVSCSADDLKALFDVAPNPETSENPNSSSEEPSSHLDLPLPAVQIQDVYNAHEFTLEEFPDVTLRIGPRILNDEGTLYVFPLYVDDVRVTEGTIDRLLFAYDVNKDGYRDLVFSENINPNGSKRARINGFDIHNMKRMENRLGAKQYNLDLVIDGEDLKARAYMASTISAVTFDYAEIWYTESNGLYFIWDNMYQFKRFELNKITLDDEDKTLVKANEFSGIYNLKVNTDYIFYIGAPREENPTITDFNFDRQSGLDVKVGDDTLPVNKFEYVVSENDVHQFRINFTDRTREFAYTFTIPCMSFSVDIRLVD